MSIRSIGSGIPAIYVGSWHQILDRHVIGTDGMCSDANNGVLRSVGDMALIRRNAEPCRGGAIDIQGQREGFTAWFRSIGHFAKRLLPCLDGTRFGILEIVLSEPRCHVFTG